MSGDAREREVVDLAENPRVLDPQARADAAQETADDLLRRLIRERERRQQELNASADERLGRIQNERVLVDRLAAAERRLSQALVKIEALEERNSTLLAQRSHLSEEIETLRSRVSVAEAGLFERLTGRFRRKRAAKSAQSQSGRT